MAAVAWTAGIGHSTVQVVRSDEACPCEELQCRGLIRTQSHSKSSVLLAQDIANSDGGLINARGGDAGQLIKTAKEPVQEADEKATKTEQLRETTTDPSLGSGAWSKRILSTLASTWRQLRSSTDTTKRSALTQQADLMNGCQQDSTAAEEGERLLGEPSMIITPTRRRTRRTIELFVVGTEALETN